MKSYLIIFSCLCLLFSCKKKEEDPQAKKADELTYETNFSDQTWSTHTTTRYTSEYESQSLKISVDTLNWVAYELAPYTDQLDYTYSMQVDVKLSLEDETKLGRAGFMYNYIDTANYCVMLILNNGAFYAYKKEMSQFSTLFYITVSKDLIKGSGQTNTIALRQYDNSQEFIFNGVSQGILPFKKVRGYIKAGLCVATDNSGLYTPLSATFDNFVIKQIY
jgi:hypothetical protein